MTTYVATQDGNWSAQATWGSVGSVPGDGDSAHIPSGIDVTVDVNTTVGLAATLSAPQASADNLSLAQSAGGSLGAAEYWIFYTNVGTGGESGPSAEGKITLTGGNKIDITLPARPAGVDSRNIYVSSDAGGTTMTGRLYATGITGTTTSLTSASWTDGTTTYANAARPPVAIMIYGTLTIAASVSLTVKGDVVMVNAPITGGAGSALVGNVPASTVYKIIMGTNDGQTGAVLTMTGTSGSKATISRTGTGVFCMAAGGRAHSGGTSANGHGGYFLTHTNIDDLGSASVNAIEFDSFGGNDFQLSNVIIDGCGQVSFPKSPDTTTRIKFDHVTIRNALGTYGLTFEVTGITPTGTGFRTMTSCVWDCAIRLSMNGFTIGNDDTDGTWFFNTRNHQGATAASFKGNLIVFNDAANSLSLDSSHSNNWFLGWNNGAEVNNIHWIQPVGSGLTIESSGNIVECPVGQGAGEFLYIGGGQATVNAHNNIGLPALNGINEPGALLNLSKNAGSTNTGQCNHNTWFVEQAIMITESAQYAGMFTSLKSNIAMGASGGSGHLITDLGLPSTEDTLAAANASHNGKFQILAGEEGGGYDYPMSGVPGANDVAEDPGFTWTNVKLWGASLGKTGTDTQIINAVLAELKLRNDPTYNSAFSVAAYRAYVQNAVRPTNVNYEDAGHDGVTIGAVEGDFGTDYTLACDSGTFTITGTDAGLEYGRIFSCDGGSYAITGTAASLEHGYKLVCASGSYLITGTDATLTEAGTFSLACDAGSFAVTGTAAGLRYSRLLSCVAGAFSITGQNASLVYSDESSTPTITGLWSRVNRIVLDQPRLTLRG